MQCYTHEWMLDYIDLRYAFQHHVPLRDPSALGGQLDGKYKRSWWIMLFFCLFDECYRAVYAMHKADDYSCMYFKII